MALARDILKFTKLLNSHIADASRVQNPSFVVPVRTAKHYDPKWKWFRGQKVMPVDLPDFHGSIKTKNERLRTRMKEMGIMPPRYWKQRPMTITSTTEVIDPYSPPEADGKASILSKLGAKDIASKVMQKKDSVLALRKIKSYEDDFSEKTFPQQAHDIYVNAHKVLMNNDQEELSQYVTDKANFEMSEGLKYKTLRWKFIESLEPPVVVQARVAPVITKTNLFAQVTVRFHTKQALAIYDRFGRLFHGSEVVAKDVLEYVVFEKHIVHEHGLWRLHDKIIPDWVPGTNPSARTYRIEEEVEEEEEDIIEEDQTEENLAETEIVKNEAEAKS